MKFKCLTDKRGWLVAALFLLLAAPRADAQVLGIGSSGTQWLTLTPNVDVSFPVSSKLSVHLPLSYNPWVFAENSRFQQLTFKPGVRFWFRECYSHFFASTYAVATRYHVGGFFKKKNRLDGTGFGVGAGAGYAYPLNKHFNIEAELGVGLIYADYDKCRWQKDSRLVSSEKGIRFIPTRFDISVVYLY